MRFSLAQRTLRTRAILALAAALALSVSIRLWLHQPEADLRGMRPSVEPFVPDGDPTREPEHWDAARDTVPMLRAAETALRNRD